MSEHSIVLGKPVIVEPSIITGSPVTVATTFTYNPVPVNIGESGLSSSSLWTGEGPPHLVIGARVGDEYLDTITGNLYRLDEGI